MLAARNISKSFKDTPILKGVNAQVRPGEINVLIGPSGVGKTTLLRALALIDLPEKGEIELDEKKYNFPFLQDQIFQPPWPHVTVVFQQLFLWPHLTLRDNILLPARNRNHPHLEEELEKLIVSLHLRPFIDHYPNEASLGQRQRVALARAIILKPKYILMDEITSALDVEQVNEIIQFLPKLKKKGIGILLITHLLNFAKQTADHVLFLDQGKVIEEGKPDILSNPQSERLAKFLSVVQAAS